MLNIAIVPKIIYLISMLIFSASPLIVRIDICRLVAVDAFSRFGRILNSMWIILIQRRIWCYPCITINLLQLHILVADK